jgi:hypothetical protein
MLLKSLLIVLQAHPLISQSLLNHLMEPNSKTLDRMLTLTTVAGNPLEILIKHQPSQLTELPKPLL